MSRLSRLRSRGILYTLRFRVVREALERSRAALARAWITSSGPQLRVGPGAVFECDAGSTIRLGTRVDVQQGASLRAMRRVVTDRGGAIVVGDRCKLKAGCLLVAKSGELVIGTRSSVGRHTEISAESANVTIGNNVRIAGSVWIATGNHRFDQTEIPIVEQGAEQKPVVIEDDVWIGEKVMILPGVRIGTGSVVAAAAVVTKDVAPMSVVAGVPARLVKRREGRVGESME